ncbi:MAG: chromosome segregation protein SMC, partial [Ruminococcus sp.]|nr:chromosome segregation protein SMC [Candidatus Apopatosoma intestinale]
MHLKKLELQGFKSFPDKTVITFDKGLTVIVGPNGSGKSNISDAMRWVLGEISSKNIRGTKMEDVIFAGSSGRSPMSFAEVSVTFDNSDPDGKILTAEDYDEITVTRRYYRVGESEYFINRKPVRLKDIHELFLNTGLGRGGYSIIGQGKIAEIISRKNEERRAVFEEAAGIAKYKYQKQEATHNLEQTETNLTRLEDIVGELEARIGPLEKESARAKKYLELYDRKKAVDIALSLYDIDGAKKRTAELREMFAVSTQNLENAEGRLAEEEARETALSEKQSAERLESERIAAEIASRTEDRHGKESGILVCEKENVMYAEQREVACGKLTEERAFAETAEKELVGKQSELSAAEERKAEKEAELAKLDGEIALYGESLAKAESDDSDTAQKKADLGKSSVDARVQISALNAEREADEKKLGVLAESAEKHDADIALYEKRMAEADEKLASLKEKEDGLLSELEKVNAEKAEKEKTRAEAERQKNENYLEVSQRRHKMQNLIRMDELLEGFSRAVRFVMTEYAADRIPGKDGQKVVLHGPLSQLISADERYAVALETAFGQNLQNIVAENEMSAKSAIDFLKRKNAGRATFYPIDTMRGTELDARTLGVAGREGFVAVASTLVKCDASLRGIVKSLVGRILIADTMDHASAMAKTLDYRYRIVTLDGQVINAGGSFTGGSVATESQFLSRRAEIEKLGAEIAELEKAGKRWETERNAADAAVGEAQKKAAALTGSVAMVRKLTEAESTQRQVLAANCDMLCEAREAIRTESAELETAIRSCEDKIVSLEREQGQYSMES